MDPSLTAWCLTCLKTGRNSEHQQEHGKWRKKRKCFKGKRQELGTAEAVYEAFGEFHRHKAAKREPVPSDFGAAGAEVNLKRGANADID
eukprot:IDg19178t1